MTPPHSQIRISRPAATASSTMPISVLATGNHWPRMVADSDPNARPSATDTRTRPSAPRKPPSPDRSVLHPQVGAPHALVAQEPGRLAGQHDMARLEHVAAGGNFQRRLDVLLDDQD